MLLTLLYMGNESTLVLYKLNSHFHHIIIQFFKLRLHLLKLKMKLYFVNGIHTRQCAGKRMLLTEKQS